MSALTIENSAGLFDLGKKRGLTLEQSYRSVVWVYACVRMISESIAGCPITVVDEAGNPVEISDYINPQNPGIPTVSELVKRIFVYLETAGGCYLYIKKKAGVVQGLELLSPLLVRPVFDRDGSLIGYARYDFKKRQRSAVYTLRELIPLLYFDPFNEYVGLAPLTAARLSVEQYYNMSSWNSAYFKGGIRSDLIIKYKKRLTADQRKDVHKAIRQYSNAVDNGRDGVLLLDGSDYDVDKGLNSISVKDLDFMEGSQLTREDICSVFGVPPALVGIFRYANYANTKEQRKIFWEQTALPKMNYLLELLQVLYFDEFFPGVKMGWDLTGVSVLKLTEKEKALVAKMYRDTGKTWDEIATILDAPELAGPEPVAEGEPPAVEEEPVEPEAGDTEPTTETSFPRRQRGFPVNTEKALYDEYRAAVNTLLGPIEKRWSFLVKAMVTQIGDAMVAKLEHGQPPQVMEGIWMGAWKEFAHPIVKSAMVFGYNTVHTEVTGKGVSSAVVKAIPRSVKELVPIEELLTRGDDLEAFENAVEVYTSRTVDISAALARDMNTAALEIYRAGGTVQDLRKALKRMVKETYEGRHLTIARTVNGGAYNGARHSAMKRAKAERIKWISARDSVVRTSHANVDGQIIVFGEQFSNGMRYPHDPYGPASEIINCRCTTVVVAVKKPKRTNRTVLPPENLEPVIQDGTKIAADSLYTVDKAAKVTTEVTQINTAEFGKTAYTADEVWDGTVKEIKALTKFTETLEKQEEWTLLEKAAAEHGEAMFKKYGVVVDDVTRAKFIQLNGELRYTLDSTPVNTWEGAHLSEKGKEALSKYLMSQWDEEVVAEVFGGKGPRLTLQIPDRPEITRAFFSPQQNSILMDHEDVVRVVKYFNTLGESGEAGVAKFMKYKGKSVEQYVRALQTLSHEAGHYIHFNSKKAAEWATEFFMERTAGEPIADVAYGGVDKATGKHKYETGLKDKLWNSYQGRVYNGHTKEEATEVISMFAQQNGISPQYIGPFHRAVEKLNLPRNPKLKSILFRAWAGDPEGYIEFIRTLSAAGGF